MPNRAEYVDYASYLICPECGSRFRNGKANGRGTRVRCEANGHVFPREASVPNLLPPRYTEIITTLKKKRGSRSPQTSALTIKHAKEWLSDALEIDVRKYRVTRRETAPRRFLFRLGTLVDHADDWGLSDADLRELCSLLSSEEMSAGYRRYVADPAVAAMEAVNYEKYEDILLRSVIANSLSTGREVALVELGSGPGRLLHQYGSVISPRDDACTIYRRLGPLLYEPESLPQRDGLRLVLGIDFADDMLRSAASWLRRDGLIDLVTAGRISQVCATVRNLPVSFESGELKQTTRVACILFQTLGNQIGRPLQLEMLSVARELIGTRGVVFVSVFNADSFGDQGKTYYDSIKGSVGAPWYWGNREFLSKRGVYSRWFKAAELKSLFAEAGMSGAHVLDEGKLEIFPDYETYIDSDSQARYKQRALIGVYSRGVKLDIAP